MNRLNEHPNEKAPPPTYSTFTRGGQLPSFYLVDTSLGPNVGVLLVLTQQPRTFAPGDKCRAPSSPHRSFLKPHVTCSNAHRDYASHQKRSGWPSLSPYLFIIAQQFLSSLINLLVDSKLITPFNLKGVEYHTLYLHMTFFWPFEPTKNLMLTFLKLSMFSIWLTNLKLNLYKSNIFFSMHCLPSIKHSICSSLGIKECSWPFKYLGSVLSLGHLPPSV